MPTKPKAPAATRITTRKTNAPMVATRASIVDIEIDHDEVARRAFARFQARGGTHGSDVDDWLEAEAELRASLR